MAAPPANSAKAVVFGGSTNRVASFCVAGVALCDTPCLERVENRRVWQAQCFQKMRCIFHGALKTCIAIWRATRIALDESCCRFLVNLIVRAASTVDNLPIAEQP